MAIAREWFQTLNLIQSRQIQTKENVKTILPSIQNGGQKLKGRSRSEEICFPEDDFKRQTATAADAAVHFKSFYCKEKVNS